jgi:predicted glycosyltransferase
MKVWIDFATPPHVLFFKPIIAELERRGHTVVITSRHSTETVALADYHRFKHTIVGRHGGETMLGKAIAIAVRAARLMWLLRREHIDLAVGHGSFSQAPAAGLVRTPVVSLTDYAGHPGGRLVVMFCRRLIVPHVFDVAELHQWGATEHQIAFYHGLKEDVYLAGFEPEPGFLEDAGIPTDKILIAARPASEVAAYHRFENRLFDEMLQYVATYDDTFIVALPRTQEQRDRFAALNLDNMMMPDNVLDGPSLVYHADIVIGAGGTMNREAVALGTPVYTMFKGMMGSVDKHLIASGRMAQVLEREDFDKIDVRKKPSELVKTQTDKTALINEIVDKILEVV